MQNFPGISPSVLRLKCTDFKTFSRNFYTGSKSLHYITGPTLVTAYVRPSWLIGQAFSYSLGDNFFPPIPCVLIDTCLS